MAVGGRGARGTATVGKSGATVGCSVGDTSGEATLVSAAGKSAGVRVAVVTILAVGTIAVTVGVVPGPG
jgi:hypothetical protein